MLTWSNSILVHGGMNSFRAEQNTVWKWDLAGDRGFTKCRAGGCAYYTAPLFVQLQMRLTTCWDSSHTSVSAAAALQSCAGGCVDWQERMQTVSGVQAGPGLPEYGGGCC